MNDQWKKIIIIGEAGRGKTTLAKKISEKYDIPLYSTDDFFWEIKYTKPREKEKALLLVNEVYKGDSWILEGTTQWLFKEGLDDSDQIIFLNFSSIFQQWFSIIRRHFSRTDEGLWSMILLLRHVFYKRYRLGYKRDSITHREVIKMYEDKTTTLSSFKQINNFL